jgi:hypothetical protein
MFYENSLSNLCFIWNNYMMNKVILTWISSHCLLLDYNYIYHMLMQRLFNNGEPTAEAMKYWTGFFCYSEEGGIMGELLHPTTPTPTPPTHTATQYNVHQWRHELYIPQQKWIYIVWNNSTIYVPSLITCFQFILFSPLKPSSNYMRHLL